MCVALDLEKTLGPGTHRGPLALVSDKPGQQAMIAAQLEVPRPGPSGQVKNAAMLWFLLPRLGAGEHRFRLVTSAQPQQPEMLSIEKLPGEFYEVREGPRPVVRYNHGTVAPPAGVAANYARASYLHPLFGPRGEPLTDDFPKDHPHHRGVGWSWPVTRWNKEVRDIWACVGVWARPVAMHRAVGGPVVAVLEAETAWKWGDQEPIVREEVVLRAFHQTASADRFLDVEVRLTALVDGVAIGGRPKGGYGGFGLRSLPVTDRRIADRLDPAGTEPRHEWLDYSGVFPGASTPSGIAILQHVANPLYPAEHRVYPELNYMMPAFPGEREFPLPKGKTIFLRHRLWIHAGHVDETALADAWAAYANPPRVRLIESDSP